MINKGFIMKITEKNRKAIKKNTPKKHKAKKRKPIWSKKLAYMEKEIKSQLNTLKKDIKNKATAEKILKDQNELLLLLGECNYIVREFHGRSIAEKK